MNTHQTLHRWRCQLHQSTLAYTFLSHALYEPPRAAWLHRLAGADVFADWPLPADSADTQTGLHLLRSFCIHWSDEQFAVVCADFDRLFVGPGPLLAPPWESVYVSDEHLLFDASTRVVREAYARFGLQAPLENVEPDDHLGLELAFLAQTASVAASLAEQDRLDDLETIAVAQRDFLAEHLMRWAGACLGRVIQHACTDYYLGLAHLTLGTLYHSAATLDMWTDAPRVPA